MKLTMTGCEKGGVEIYKDFVKDVPKATSFFGLKELNKQNEIFQFHRRTEGWMNIIITT